MVLFLAKARWLEKFLSPQKAIWRPPRSGLAILPPASYVSTRVNQVIVETTEWECG
jgi:hypothetical protein